MEYNEIADMMLRAVIMAGFKIPFSRSATDVSVVFTNDDLKSSVYAVTDFGHRIECRILDENDVYKYLSKDEFIAELGKRFRERGILIAGAAI